MKNTFIRKNKNIIIAGCGRMGAILATRYSENGYGVMIIDKEEKKFQRLKETFSGFQIVGDAASIDILNSVNIENVDMIVAVTNDDSDNLMIGQIASKIYNINKIIIRLKDTEKGKLIKETNINIIYPFALSLKEFDEIVDTKFKEAKK